MNIKEHIEKLFREIEVYCSHSLFVEAEEKCEKLEKLIRQNGRLKNKQELLDVVTKKRRNLKKDARRFEEEGTAAQVAPKQQYIIEKLFTSPQEEGSDSTALEGATSLLVFGQFEKALSAFNELIKSDSLRLIAAKNILRCHIGLSALDDAVGQYNQWFSSGQFASGELDTIRSFLQDILNKRGIDKDLPKPEVIEDAKEDEIPEETIQEEDAIDILSINIPIDDGSKKGKGLTFDVTYQKGYLISMIIPRSNQVLINNLQVGSRVNNIKCYSPAVVFNDAGVVSAKREIKSGPKKGDYTLTMKILNI